MTLGLPPWSLASTPIWALVSGYESSVRVGKLLAFLQAFVDDSAGNAGDKRLFMAGFLHRAEEWALFSDAWAAGLQQCPAIEYFKMVEANGMRGQFGGWTAQDRDEKLCYLASIIRRFKPFSFQCSISQSQYCSLVRPHSPRGVGNPYFACTFGVVAALTRYAASQGINTPIDFIFDEQSGVNDDIGMLFEFMKDSLPKESQKLINGNPIFRSDKLFLPIQAADMLAWNLRREHETCIPQKQLPMADSLRSERGHLVSHIDVDLITSLSETFKKLPHIPEMQGKLQWKKTRKDCRNLMSRGVVPIYYESPPNMLYRIRYAISRIFGC